MLAATARTKLNENFTELYERSEPLPEDTLALRPTPITLGPLVSTVCRRARRRIGTIIGEPCIITTIRVADSVGNQYQKGYQWMQVYEAGTQVRGWSPIEEGGSDDWMPWRNLASTDNSRFPTFEQKAALAGTEGTVSDTNVTLRRSLALLKISD